MPAPVQATHWIAYYSVDNAGNVELVNQCSVTIAGSGVGRRIVLRGTGRRAAL